MPKFIRLFPILRKGHRYIFWKNLGKKDAFFAGVAGKWSKSLLAVQWAVQIRRDFASGSILLGISGIGLEKSSPDEMISILSKWLRPQPCIPCSAKRWNCWTMSVLTKVSLGLVSGFSLCPVLTRPTQERICSFFRGKEASAVFPYTYLTEEQPTEHNAYFPIVKLRFPITYAVELHYLNLFIINHFGPNLVPEDYLRTSNGATGAALGQTGPF